MNHFKRGGDSDSFNKKWRGRFFRYAPLILWIGVIFFASSSAGSMSNTSRFVRPLLEFLFPQTPEDVLLIYHGYVRKAAHVIEYAILAFWASRAFAGSAVQVLQKFWYFFALVLVLIVAVADETNQSFLASRTSSILDVGFDLAGGVLGAAIFCLLAKILNRRKSFKTNLDSD